MANSNEIVKRGVLKKVIFFQKKVDKVNARPKKW